MEGIIVNRWEWYFEHNELLTVSQYGYRRGRGTADTSAQLVSDVQ